MGEGQDFRACRLHIPPGRISMMAPESIGAANLRYAEGDPCEVDFAGEQIDNFNSTIGDWTPIGIVAASIVERQAWHLARRTGITPALALALAPFVYGEGAR